MNKFEKTYYAKLLKLAKEMPNDNVKLDSKGRVQNWKHLSESTKEWLTK